MAFKLSHEGSVQALALAAGFPAVLFAGWVIGTGDYSAKVMWTLGLSIGGAWLGLGYAVRERIASPLRTVSNLLEAIREGDYSIRATGAAGTDALAEVMQQVNAMGATMRSQRLGALEATTLLRKVMEEIDVSIFAFDEKQKLRLVNRAGERLLGQTSERMLELEAGELGLAEYLEDETVKTVQRVFPGGSGRWGISRSSFREGGLPHRLLVLTDLTRPLREEELQAWQRLVRVLGHELNNSLAPIKSIAGSLETIAKRDPLPEDWREDMQSGLSVIAARSESLARFMGAYAKFARLPRPALAPVRLLELVPRIVRMEVRMSVEIVGGPDITVQADADQLEQLLINLVKNGVEAARETGGGVRIRWELAPWQVELRVEDEGPGLAATTNLFVPFFTTKPSGSGIGLVLCRQIAEGHGGSLTLENREGPGCVALLRLPVQ
ncbi:MAG: ATP-binding protein [Acidobacteria bacterium]|nr:ATP-binding protein [Acidobacteriota bacterium]